MPLIVIMCVTTLAQSISIGCAGQAEHRDPAAVVEVGDHVGQRARVPAHLQRDVEALDHAEPALGVGDRLARARRARGRRPSRGPARAGTRETSVITTKRAPTCRHTAAAISPIGPAPVISTSSPTSGNDSAVCTALPNGSKIAPRSGSTRVVVHPHVRLGQHDVLGERAVAVHADARRADAQVPAAGAAVAAGAADDVALARHEVADARRRARRRRPRRPRRRTRGRGSAARRPRRPPRRPTTRCAGRCRRSRCAAPGS